MRTTNSRRKTHMNFWEDNQRVGAGFHTLLRQAKGEAADYMEEAVTKIDELFGKGYAAKNPTLVGAFMRTAAQDFHTACTLIASQNIQEALNSLQPPLDFSIYQSTKETEEV
jgi:ribosomal protein S20